MLQLTGINLYHKVSDAAGDVLHTLMSGSNVVVTIDCFFIIWMTPSNQQNRKW
jgi:hypothetical protein